MIKKTRVAVVSGHFVWGRGYQENCWVEELVRRGNDVRVFASRHVPVGLTHERPRLPQAFAIEHVPALSFPHGIILSWELARRVSRWQPDWILWFGVAQHFGRSLVRSRTMTRARIATFFSECSSGREYDWRKPGIPVRERLRAVSYRVVRGGVVRAACRASDIVIANTPQTAPILMSLVASERERVDLSARLHQLPLGFDPEVFAFDPALRVQTRNELELAEDDVLVCMSTRFSQTKRHRLRIALSALSEVLAAENRVRFLVVGLGTDSTSLETRQLLSQGASAKKVRFHDLADRTRLNALFNASDIALFTAASISCQESLATGTVGCFAGDGSTTHLRRIANQVYFYEPGDPKDLAQELLRAARMMLSFDSAERLRFRQSLAQASRWLGYDRIADAFLAITSSVHGNRQATS